MIKAFVDACRLCETLMEVADQLDGVGHLSLTMTAKEVADGDVSWTPERFACQTCQMFVEEQGCTLVGEDHCDTRQVSAVFLEQVGCDVFKEGFHSDLLLFQCDFFNSVGINKPEIAFDVGMSHVG